MQHGGVRHLLHAEAARREHAHEVEVPLDEPQPGGRVARGLVDAAQSLARRARVQVERGRFEAGAQLTREGVDGRAERLHAHGRRG